MTCAKNAKRERKEKKGLCAHVSGVKRNTTRNTNLHYTHFPAQLFFVCERIAQPQWLSAGTVPAHVVLMSFFVVVSCVSRQRSRQVQGFLPIRRTCVIERVVGLC